MGFPVDHPDGILAEGRTVEVRPDGSIQMVGPDAAGYWIEAGFSGGGVWDKGERALLGIISQRETAPGLRVAFMVPLAQSLGRWPELQRLVTVRRPEGKEVIHLPAVADEPLSEIMLALRLRLARFNPEVLATAARALVPDSGDQRTVGTVRALAKELVSTTMSQLVQATMKLRLDVVDVCHIQEIYDIAVPFAWAALEAADRLHVLCQAHPRPTCLVALSTELGLTGTMYVQCASRTHPGWPALVVPPPVGENQNAELIDNARASIKEALALAPQDRLSDAELALRVAGKHMFLTLPPPPPDRIMVLQLCATFPAVSFLLLGGALTADDVTESIATDAVVLTPPISSADENVLEYSCLYYWCDLQRIATVLHHLGEWAERPTDDGPTEAHSERRVG